MAWGITPKTWGTAAAPAPKEPPQAAPLFLGGGWNAGAQGDQLLAHLYLSSSGNVAVRETHAFREGTDHNDRRVIACGLNRGPV